VINIKIASYPVCLLTIRRPRKISPLPWWLWPAPGTLTLPNQRVFIKGTEKRGEIIKDDILEMLLYSVKMWKGGQRAQSH
jgi:hypothetical protein